MRGKIESGIKGVESSEIMIFVEDVLIENETKTGRVPTWREARDVKEKLMPRDRRDVVIKNIPGGDKGNWVE